MRERSKESKETGKRIPDGYGDICLSLRPRTRARERTQARKRSRKAQKAQSEAKREAFVQRWLDTIFANGIEDPVPVVVTEAIRKFGSERDRLIWTWYCTHIGVNSFLEAIYLQEQAMSHCSLRSPAAAFHSRLKRMSRFAISEVRGR